jgi:hypothetical protein
VFLISYVFLSCFHAILLAEPTPTENALITHFEMRKMLETAHLTNGWKLESLLAVSPCSGWPLNASTN